MGVVVAVAIGGGVAVSVGEGVAVAVAVVVVVAVAVGVVVVVGVGVGVGVAVAVEVVVAVVAVGGGAAAVVGVVLKTTFEKAEPLKLTYRYYKNFSFDRFKGDLENALKCCPNSYDVLNSVFHSNLMNLLLKKQSG